MTRVRLDRLLHATPVLLLAMIALLVPSTFARARAAMVQIRMATLVPTGSLWDKNLRQMGSEWSRATGGRITLTVFPGGAMGDEATLVRKMRFDSPQAAALSAIGLSRIDDAFTVFSSPFFFESYDELNHVISALTPTLSTRLEQKGIVLLAWGHAGWAYLFTTTPVKTMDDLKRIRIFTSAGDDRMVQWYKTNGFQPRALATTDILTGLTSGMIDGLPAPPVAALAFQWFRHTKYMVEPGIAPVIGAIVITRKTWEGIPESDRQVLRTSARAFEQRLSTEVPRAEKESIAEMQKRGLTVITNQDGEWRTQAQSLASTLPGMVPPEIFEMAAKARDAYRQARPR
jgi:TRAP-type C4-dicarboxylate transport system substrate-binding protein